MEDVLHQLDKASIDFDSAVARMRVELIEARNQKQVLGKILDVLQQMQSVLNDVRNQVKFSADVMKTVAKVEDDKNGDEIDWQEEGRKLARKMPQPPAPVGQVVESKVEHDTLQVTVAVPKEKVPGVLMKDEVAAIDQKIASQPPPPKVEKKKFTTRGYVYKGAERTCIDCKKSYQPTGPRQKRCVECQHTHKMETLRAFRAKQGLPVKEDKPTPKPEPPPEPKETYHPRHCGRVVKGERCDIVFVPQTKQQLYCSKCTQEVARERVPGVVSQAVA